MKILTLVRQVLPNMQAVSAIVARSPMMLSRDGSEATEQSDALQKCVTWSSKLDLCVMNAGQEA